MMQLFVAFSLGYMWGCVSITVLALKIADRKRKEGRQ
jgi:hypothetical protein